MAPRRKTMLLIGMTMAILVLAYSQNPTVAGHRMVKFTSQDELQRFLVDKSLYCGDNGLATPSTWTTDVRTLSFAGSKSEPSGTSSPPSHSETNNQVQGVDELDTVKTDGDYIYTVSGSKLVILKAYPATQAEVASEIWVNGTVIGVFVKGDKLAIFGQATPYYAEPSMSLKVWDGPYWSSSEMSIWIYDIQNRANPVLRNAMSVEGSYIGSRMIGDFVYLVASQGIPYCGRDFQLPRQVVDQRTTIVLAQQIYHSDLEDYGHTFTNVLGFDITRDGEDSSFESFMLGSSGSIYVSSRDLYLTAPVYNGESATVIHRIQLDRETISYEATGQVPGTILNQFSMDEHGDYFRVATHAWRTSAVMISRTNGSQPVAVTSTTTQQVAGPSSNVYVLTRNLKIIGRLEGLGQGEQFHSARFMGDRAYLVTFKKVDPLFAIDLQDPNNPKVLGELKVTGYSDYLQPYDENHLIGIGKEADDQGSFAWFMGVKVSLFDVTDPENPSELGKYVIGDRGTESPALAEHKAVLFDRGKNLLVIPVSVAKTDGGPPAWGSPDWQGAYVFAVSLEGGIEFRGGITHLGLWEIPSYENQDRWVSRSLYIEDVLYTISPTFVKMNSLSDLHEISSVRL